MPTDDIDRLRKDYEAACVDFYEIQFPAGTMVPVDGYGPHRPVVAARQALQAALARQQKDSEDEDAVLAACQANNTGPFGPSKPIFSRKLMAPSDVIWVMDALRAAGFEVRRKDRT